MGLGDIFKGAAGVALPGLSSGVNAIREVAQDAGEAVLRRGNEARTNPDRGGESGHANVGPGIINQRGNPAGQFTNITTNSFLDVGEEYEKNLQSKVDAAHGFYRLGHTLATNPTEIWRGGKAAVNAVRENPGLLVDTAKTVGTEMAISTMMDPTTYMGGGLAIGAAAAERTAARTAARAAEGVAEETAARVAVASADDLAGATVRAGLEAAPEGLDDALRATVGNPARAATRSGQFTQAVDEAPVNLRERVTGNPQGRLGQARFDLGERAMPGPQPNIARSLIKDTLQGSPTVPTEGAGLGFRQAKWRATRVGSMLAAPAQARTIEHVGLALNDPVKALTSPEAMSYAQRGAEWAIREHPEAAAAVGGIIAANAGLGAYGTIKGITGALEGDGEASGSEATEQAKQAVVPPPSPHLDSIQDIGLSQFHADQGHAQAVRRPGQRSKRLGTVQRNTMPNRIGPSNWYGPQGGYQAGRGFRQRDDVLGV
jgi:hypothetical protein